MGMSTGSGEGNLVADINVTPMVDVMLVLLIIFMLITPMLQSGVNVTLPQSKNPDIDMNINKETSAVVAVPADGQYYLNRDKVNLTDLPEKVRNLLKDKPIAEQVVYIKGSDNVKYGTVVAVVDALRDADFTAIGLVTKKQKEQGADSANQPPAK
ncbi:MAG TPA: biopolymer transporter ExbD [Blastocatellia bacterium]|nr:biopolymer transporter ExbD [Blastocatellia bacterium]